MSKKITHIKAKENLKKISWSKGYFEKEEQELKDYITQQEKQEKLLELSLKLNDVWKNRHQYNNSVGLIEDLEQQINELENEDIGFTTEIINLSELEK